MLFRHYILLIEVAANFDLRDEPTVFGAIWYLQTTGAERIRTGHPPKSWHEMGVWI